MCEYAVILESRPSDHVMPFPACPQTTWGVQEATAARYGVEPVQRCGAVLRTSDAGRAELRLRMRGDGRLRFHSDVITYRGTDGRTAMSVDAAVVHRVVGDVATFSFTLVQLQLQRCRFTCAQKLTYKLS